MHALILSGCCDAVKRGATLIDECLSTIQSEDSEKKGDESPVLPQECVFCYGDFPAFSSKKSYVILSTCGHLSCPECLAQYATEFSRNPVLPLRCPGVGCAQLIRLADVKSVMEVGEDRKYTPQVCLLVYL